MAKTLRRSRRTATMMALLSTVALAACGSDDEGKDVTATAKEAAATSTDAGSAAGSKAPGGTVKVGNITSIAGIGGVFAGYEAGVEAYFAYMNERGGIDGTTVEYIGVDDGGDPGKAAAGARKLVQDDVLAVVGQASLADAATAKYLAQNDVPALGGWATSPGWYPPNSNMFASAMGPQEPYCPAAADAIAKQRGMKNVAYLVADFPAAVSDSDCRRASGKFLEVADKGQIKIAPTQADLRPSVRRAIDAGADTIYISAGGDQQVKAIQAGDQLGFKGLYIVTQPAGVVSGLASLAAKLDGRVLTATYTVLPSDPAGQNEELDAFREGMAKHAPKFQDEITAVGGWAAGRFFADALRAAGADRKAIIAWAAGQSEYDFAGLQGPVDYTDGSKPAPCWTALELKGGEFVRADDEFVCSPLLDFDGKPAAYHQHEGS